MYYQNWTDIMVIKIILRSQQGQLLLLTINTVTRIGDAKRVAWMYDSFDPSTHSMSVLQTSSSSSPIIISILTTNKIIIYVFYLLTRKYDTPENRYAIAILFIKSYDLITIK